MVGRTPLRFSVLLGPCCLEVLGPGPCGSFVAPAKILSALLHVLPHAPDSGHHRGPAAVRRAAAESF